MMLNEMYFFVFSSTLFILLRYKDTSSTPIKNIAAHLDYIHILKRNEVSLSNLKGREGKEVIFVC